MHILSALSALLLQPLLTVPTTERSLSDVLNKSFISSLDATNFSSSLTGSNSLASSIFLTFDLFGFQIPSSAVNAAFNGAIARIHPFLQNQPNAPITNDNFQYRAVGGSVQIGITGAPHQRVSWQQVDSVLRQAASFMNGDLGASRQHFQELSFEIINDGTKIGEGLVTYHRSPGLQSANSMLANLTNSNDTRLISAATDPSINLLTTDPIPFPIPDTPFTLIFGFLSQAIPTPSVEAAFEGVHSEIFGSVAEHPTSRIPGDRFEYDKDFVHIIVVANQGIWMTWKQLSWVLGGLYGFMTGTPEHCQILACDIVFTGHGNIGFAAVGYYPPSLEVTKRVPLNVNPNMY